MAAILKFKPAADTLVIFMGIKLYMNLHTINMINYICTNFNAFVKLCTIVSYNSCTMTE